MNPMIAGGILFLSLSSLHADWSVSPTILDQPSPNASSSAYIVVDMSGNITAAWLENTDAGTVVEASYYSIHSGTWSTPTIIDQDNTGALQPRLIVDQFNMVTAVWLEYLGGNYLVQAARFNGTTWTAPVTLNNGGAYLGSPLMTVDLSGNVTVVWLEAQESNWVVQAARFSDGAWTESPTTLDGDTQNANFNIPLQMVVDGQANVTVTWVENIDSALVIEAARFSGGAWTAAVVLDNGTQTPNAFPYTALQLIVDEQGNVIVTWLENSTNPVAVQVARFSAPPPPFAPANLRGYQHVNQFLTQSDSINILQWSAPSLGEIPVAYRVYRDASLTDLADVVLYTSTQQLEFFDHNRKPGVQYSYYIVSVDAQGNVSAPASIVVG